MLLHLLWRMSYRLFRETGSGCRWIAVITSSASIITAGSVSIAGNMRPHVLQAGYLKVLRCFEESVRFLNRNKQVALVYEAQDEFQIRGVRFPENYHRMSMSCTL